MSVYKKRICTKCRSYARDQKVLRNLPRCDCGAEMAYHDNWFVSVRVKTSAGQSRLIEKAAGKTKEEAQNEERRLLLGRSEGQRVDGKTKLTFKEAASVFLEWVSAQEAQKKLREGTARPYRYRLEKHLLPYFGQTSLREITHDAMDEYVATRQLADVRPATINREIATMKRIFSVALKKRLITSHPLMGYELLPEDNAREIHLNAEQISKLLTECAKAKYPAHLYPIVLLALHTGLRRDGCVTLRWEEIDWSKGEITKVVKGGKTVRIPMTAKLKDVLTAWRTRDGVIRGQGPVFPSPITGKPMLVTSQFGFQTACKAVGLDELHFHDLRHTFATLFLEQFPDRLETLREIMGHSGAYMTRRYAHITDRSKHEAMEKFSLG